MKENKFIKVSYKQPKEVQGIKSIEEAFNILFDEIFKIKTQDFVRVN